ncbi:uncharacterized protein LOC129218055 [Uloborus diversus]|uniref:uncharacterized protein LOC129218055 n=1 Tax=Uloborus diversus TaxID=327109 RepID=UPI00240A254E|nr:uncharacterized protein LOC129218055 [Uloborus diversus]
MKKFLLKLNNRVLLLTISLNNCLQKRVNESLENIPDSLMEDIVASIVSKKQPESPNKETSSSPKETSSSPKETSSSPKETSSFPKETSSSPKETSSTPKETSSEADALFHDSPSEDKHFFQILHRLLAGSTASIECIKKLFDEINIETDCKADATESIIEQKEPDFNSKEDGQKNISYEKTEDLFSIPESNRRSKDIPNIEAIFASEDIGGDFDVLFESSSNYSVSSVHTSDLSSYDDAISISTDDEECLGTKHISVKEALEICYGGPGASNEIVECCKKSKKTTKSTQIAREMKHHKKQASANWNSENISPSPKMKRGRGRPRKKKSELESAENISSSSEFPGKKLPERNRKLNPKYNSQSIIPHSRAKSKKVKN